ncbi:uncharacterized protein LOC129728923 [Wyeomyia smithii]|uniref:uncharacterized protein LOC129728923 n=1 Tax=Wyeomyia smithii TaxID=174621 RepID=UPI002467D70A|nr:uncharacterized protein LOC129728923 [Wyeomyia smithii]
MKQIYKKKCAYSNRAGMEYRIKSFITTIESSHLPVAWAKWKRDLEAYFDAGNIESQADKRSKLLYLGGSDLREIYDNLPETEKVSYVLNDPPCYDAAIAKLDAHFEPFLRRIYERHQFKQISRKSPERFSDFVLRLRTQIKRCEYEKADEMILDQIVEKCASNKLREKMLKKDMRLEEVEALGTSLEESKKKLKDFSVTTTVEKINKIWKQPVKQDRGWNQTPQRIFRSSSARGRPNSVYTRRPGTGRSEPVCFSCGRRGHTMGAEFCLAKHAACLQCKNIGHFARQCRKRPNQDRQSTVAPKRIRTVQGESVQETTNEENQNEGYIFYAMGNNTFRFTVGGVNIPMVIDSGAAANVISQSAWEEMKRKGVAVQDMTTIVDKTLIGYGTNTPMKITGSFTVTVQVGGQQTDAKFYVAKSGQQCLLGDDTAKALHVLKVGFGIGRVEESSMEFPKIKGVTIEIPIDHSIQPVHQAYRRVPYAL